jgi:hypothetical protein
MTIGNVHASYVRRVCIAEEIEPTVTSAVSSPSRPRAETPTAVAALAELSCREVAGALPGHLVRPVESSIGDGETPFAEARSDHVHGQARRPGRVAGRGRDRPRRHHDAPFVELVDTTSPTPFDRPPGMRVRGIFGILGVNGAGGTTTVRMPAGFAGTRWWRHALTDVVRFGRRLATSPSSSLGRTGHHRVDPAEHPGHTMPVGGAAAQPNITLPGRAWFMLPHQRAM